MGSGNIDSIKEAYKGEVYFISAYVVNPFENLHDFARYLQGEYGAA